MHGPGGARVALHQEPPARAQRHMLKLRRAILYDLVVVDVRHAVRDFILRHRIIDIASVRHGNGRIQQSPGMLGFVGVRQHMHRAGTTSPVGIPALSTRVPFERL